MWKQMKGKFSTLKEETLKWIHIQENLSTSIEKFLENIKESIHSWENALQTSQ
jgi:hypothetical protein